MGDDPISTRINGYKRRAPEIKISLQHESFRHDAGACGCGRCLGYWTDPVSPVLRHMDEEQVRRWAELAKRALISRVFKGKLKVSKACQGTYEGHEKCKGCDCPCHILELIEWGGS